MARCVQCTCAACGNTMTPNTGARERVSAASQRVDQEIARNNQLNRQITQLSARTIKLEAGKGFEAVELLGSVAGPSVGCKVDQMVSVNLSTGVADIEIGIRNNGHGRAFMIFVVRPKAEDTEPHEALERAALAMMEASEQIQKQGKIGTPIPPISDVDE